VSLGLIEARFLSISTNAANMLGSLVTPYVARDPSGVLKAKHAQMDERALEAPQERAGKGRS